MIDIILGRILDIFPEAVCAYVSICVYMNAYVCVYACAYVCLRVYMCDTHILHRQRQRDTQEEG